MLFLQKNDHRERPLNNFFSMKEIIKKFKITEIFRYGMVTVGSYIVLYLGTYFLVEKIGLSPRLSYGIILTLVYIGVYISYMTYVFKEDFSRETLKRFLIILTLSWLLNNAFFSLLNHTLGIPYMIVMVLNTLVFGALRFSLQRFYVFKSSDEKQ